MKEGANRLDVWYRVQVQKILDLRALGVYLTTCIIIILDMKGGGGMGGPPLNPPMVLCKFGIVSDCNLLSILENIIHYGCMVLLQHYLKYMYI